MNDIVQPPGGEVIEGLVLCRVGDDRLAVRALEISAFEAADPTAPYAGAAFTPGAVAPTESKLLRHHALRLVVDSVEVHPERLPVLPVPSVLARTWGGALAGFVEAGGALWPLVSLATFAASQEPAP